jgi:hypothetical protein
MPVKIKDNNRKLQYPEFHASSIREPKWIRGHCTEMSLLQPFQIKFDSYLRNCGTNNK